MQKRIHDAFAQVHAADGLKSDTLAFLQNERKKRARRHAAWKQPVLAACAVLALVLGLGTYRAYAIPVSYVSIDVNPSIELALNRFDRIITATSYNAEGLRVLDGLSLEGKSCTEGIELLLDSGELQRYLTEDEALTFTVAASDTGKETALLSGIARCAGYGRSCRASMDCLSEAHSLGMSFGKYNACRTLVQCDSGVTMEDCQGMTMGEIHARIRVCESAGADEAGKGHHWGGNGHGRGRSGW